MCQPRGFFNQIEWLLMLCENKIPVFKIHLKNEVKIEKGHELFYHFHCKQFRVQTAKTSLENNADAR